MAKWSMDYPGQSGHRINLNAIDTLRIFLMKVTPKYERHDAFYVGGLKAYEVISAMTSPTVNSYTRLVRGAWFQLQQLGVLRTGLRPCELSRATLNHSELNSE